MKSKRERERNEAKKRDDEAFSIANAERRDTISYFPFDVIIIIIGGGSSFHSRSELAAVSSSFALINRSRFRCDVRISS